MDIVSFNRTVQAPPVTAPVVPADQAAENREVVQAVRAVNGAEMFGHDNILTFQKDAVTNRMVVRVVNRKTNEVISQVPAEYVLRLSEDLKQKGS